MGTKRRMFSQQITDSDAFIDLPLSAQALYLHISMAADDDGFVNSAKKIQRSIGASESDLNELIEKRFLILLGNGIVVVKHWRINNSIRKDRYTPTQYQEEYKSLKVKDNNAYTERGNRLSTNRKPNDNQTATKCQPNDNPDKVRLDKNSGSSLRGGEKLINRLTSEESTILFDIYKDADYLIDEVQRDVDKKHKVVEKPFQYIVGYAEKKGWQENGD